MKHFIGHDEYEEVFDQFRDVGLYDGMVKAMAEHNDSIETLLSNYFGGCLKMADDDQLKAVFEIGVLLQGMRNELRDQMTRMDGEDMTTTKPKGEDDETTETE